MPQKSSSKHLSISQLKDQIEITDVLEEIGTKANPRNGWQGCRCPFHMDRAASASVNSVIQRFKCHACDISGDILDLAMAYLDTQDHMEAMQWLEKRFL